MGWEVVRGSVFLLVGAPTVGKSSAAHALALRFPKSVHIPVDNLRDMVVSGIVHPGDDWSVALIEQLKLARKTATQMAIDYSRAGFDVVIDGFWDPRSRLAEYEGLSELPSAHKVLLYPSQEIAEARNLKRSGAGQASEYIAAGIRQVYVSLKAEVDALRGEGWWVIDTTDASIDDTVDRAWSGVAQQSLLISNVGVAASPWGGRRRSEQRFGGSQLCS
jgi:predicted kinase